MSSTDRWFNRHRLTSFFAASVMAAGLTASVSPVASAADKNGEDNTPEQCLAAHQAVASGEPLPNLRLFRKGHGALHGNTLTLFNDDSRYSDEIEAAAAAWNQATGGEIQVKVTDHETKNSVRVYDVDRDTHWVGWTRHEPWRILLNSNFLETMSPQERQSTITHEFGHALGLKHGCPGDVMHAYSDYNQAIAPTATDIQALFQDESETSDSAES